MKKKRKSALGEFFSGNYSQLISYVRAMLDDSAHRSSEDIVQDVMVGILDRPDIVAPVSNLSAYVFRALRNRIIDHYRKSPERTVSLDRQDEEGSTLFDVLADARFDPENSYHRHAQHRLAISLIRELPPAQMEVIVETEFNGRTFKELSVLREVPVGTLLARKHRGIRALRKKLEKLQEEGNW